MEAHEVSQLLRCLAAGWRSWSDDELDSVPCNVWHELVQLAGSFGDADTWQRIRAKGEQHS